jgi:hypothetical protein
MMYAQYITPPNEGGSCEQVDSTDSPLAVDYLYSDRHRQLCRNGSGRTSGLGGLFAIAAALPDVGHRSLHVHTAVFAQPGRGSASCVSEGCEEDPGQARGRKNVLQDGPSSLSQPKFLSGSNPPIAKGYGDAFGQLTCNTHVVHVELPLHSERPFSARSEIFLAIARPGPKNFVFLSCWHLLWDLPTTFDRTYIKGATWQNRQ